MPTNKLNLTRTNPPPTSTTNQTHAISLQENMIMFCYKT